MEWTASANLPMGKGLVGLVTCASVEVDLEGSMEIEFHLKSERNHRRILSREIIRLRFTFISVIPANEWRRKQGESERLAKRHYSSPERIKWFK